jgi:hypothetical protein
MLTNVEGLSQTGTVIQIDNKFFLNCRFERCQIVYSGGDVGWAGTTFTDCTLAWHGDADRTIKVLGLFGFEITKPTKEPSKESKLGFSL